MNIPELGPLRPHKRIRRWLTSEPVAIPYFDGQKLAFVLDGLAESDANDARTAINAFLKLTPEDRLAAGKYVFENYQTIAALVEEHELGCEITSPDEVWAHVHPSEIFVSKRGRRDKDIYIRITAECDWEPEHGLQIIYRRGQELSRVSEQDGHLTHTDAYDLPEEQDNITDNHIHHEPSAQPPPKNFSFFGRRLYFFLLAPWLLLGVILLPVVAGWQVEEKRLAGLLIAVVFAVCCLCGLLIGISPKRFRWTGVFVTGSVAAAYIWYFCDTYFVQGQPLTPSSSRSEATPWNAICGFICIGLPCLLFTIQKVKSWTSRAGKKIP